MTVQTHHEKRAEIHPPQRGILHLRHLEENLQQLFLALQILKEKRGGGGGEGGQDVLEGSN